jgi:hypothetical protein
MAGMGADLGTSTAAGDVVVADLEVTVQAPDPGAALDACRPLAERVGALVRRVTRVPDEEEPLFEVRLARTEALRQGEPVQEALTRVNRRLLDVLGRSEEVTPDHPRRMSGVSFVDEDGALLPAGTFVSTVVRMSDVEDPFDGYERLEPEWPEDGDPGLDAGAAAELAAVVQALTWTKVVLIADIVGRDPVDAREDLRALAAGVEDEVFLAEPEPGEGGSVRVWAVLGMADGPAEELVEQACSALAVTGWITGAADVPGRVVLEWAPPEAPAAGVARLQLRIGGDVVRLGDRGLALAPS